MRCIRDACAQGRQDCPHPSACANVAPWWRSFSSRRDVAYFNPTPPDDVPEVEKPALSAGERICWTTVVILLFWFGWAVMSAARYAPGP